MKKNEKNKMIKGIIIPVDWDEKGNILRVSIQTTEEEEYIIEQSKTGVELLSHVHKKINAKGATRNRLDGKVIITVKEYTLIPDYNHSAL